MAEKIAIIGGGFSGCAVAVSLLHAARGRGCTLEIILVEKSNAIACGMAYRTEDLSHLLNVPAKNMSFYPDQPEHFLEWLQLRGVSASPQSFLPRKIYGEYLRETFEQIRAEHNGGLVRILQEEAVGLSETANGQICVQFLSGEVLAVDRLVLATGNFKPAEFFPPSVSQLGPDRYLPDPWAPLDWEKISKNHRSILLIGTALSSVDIILSLRNYGFRGTIHALSRRGCLPEAHKAYSAVVPIATEEFAQAKRLTSLVRMIRKKIEEEQKKLDGNWRAVLDGLRPHTQQIWNNLSLPDKKRFFRHLLGIWNQHRHRMAPEVAEIILALRNKGFLRTHAGRLQEVVASLEGIEVEIQPRGESVPKRISCDLIINCTGPSRDFTRAEHLLFRSLLDLGWAVPDETGQGLSVDSEGALLSKEGIASSRIFTMGALRIGRLWETVAVPELRVQAQALALRVPSDSLTESDIKPENPGRHRDNSVPLGS